jgi:hypothetical protein
MKIKWDTVNILFRLYATIFNMPAHYQGAVIKLPAPSRRFATNRAGRGSNPGRWMAINGRCVVILHGTFFSAGQMVGTAICPVFMARRLITENNQSRLFVSGAWPAWTVGRLAVTRLRAA